MEKVARYSIYHAIPKLVLNIKLSVYFSGQRKLEEFQTHLDEETSRKDKAQEQLEGSSKVLLKVRSGIEHLSEKLKHLKAVSKHDCLEAHFFQIYGHYMWWHNIL